MTLETEPLLSHRNGSTLTRSYSSTTSKNGVVPQESSSETSSTHVEMVIEDVKLGRHITLTHAVGIMLGNVIGSGIFVSSRGITEKMGTVGASLIIWSVTGMYVLLQCLCYAELGTAVPVVGGDYAFAWQVLGGLPAFLTMWIHIIIIAPSATGAIAQTAGLYLGQAMNLQCNHHLVSIIAVCIITLFAFINALSVKFSARLNTLMSTIKTLALCFIIITGLIHVIMGNTENLRAPFRGSTTDPGLIALAVLDGYYAYKGWELVATLPEEMINPKKDLPVAMVASMLLIITIYCLTNLAYFVALSPADIITSDAIALTFAQKLLGSSGAWVMCIMVAISCMGTVNSGFLTDTRYLFAAGRTNQVPQTLSMISINNYTPIPALLVIALLDVLYSLTPDLEILLQYASLGVQMKISVALVALLVLRRKKPHLERPFSVHWIVPVSCLGIIAAMVGLSLWRNPSTAGVGIGLCLLGIPAFGLTTLMRSNKLLQNVNRKVTDFCQMIFLVTSETKQTVDR